MVTNSQGFISDVTFNQGSKVGDKVKIPYKDGEFSFEVTDVLSDRHYVTKFGENPITETPIYTLSAASGGKTKVTPGWD